MCSSNPVSLEFSLKYDRKHAEQYLKKHQDGMARCLSHWRDEQLARRALKRVGDPGVVLDLPCGAGRFWPLLASKSDRVILAADNSSDMISIAQAGQPTDIVKRVDAFQTSAFSIDLTDGAVDCIFCMRLLHHISDGNHRIALLREFYRVSRDTVIVSLWVDGNYKAFRRRRLEKKRVINEGGRKNRNRFIVQKRVIEAEFKQAGFVITGHYDFLPGYAMWRVYMLRKMT